MEERDTEVLSYHTGKAGLLESKKKIVGNGVFFRDN